MDRWPHITSSGVLTEVLYLLYNVLNRLRALPGLQSPAAGRLVLDLRNDESRHQRSLAMNAHHWLDAPGQGLNWLGSTIWADVTKLPGARD